MLPLYDRISDLENAEAKWKREGKLEGKLESKLEVVRESLSQGLEISLISKITGLSEEEIIIYIQIILRICTKYHCS